MIGSAVINLVLDSGKKETGFNSETENYELHPNLERSGGDFLLLSMLSMLQIIR
jgi:hypothetical protein